MVALPSRSTVSLDFSIAWQVRADVPIIGDENNVGIYKDAAAWVACILALDLRHTQRPGIFPKCLLLILQNPTDLLK